MFKKAAPFIVLLILIGPLSAQASVLMATGAASSILCGPNLADYSGHHSGKVLVLSADDVGKTFSLFGELQRSLPIGPDTESICSQSGSAGNGSQLNCTTAFTGRCTETRFRGKSTAEMVEASPDQAIAIGPWRKRNNCEFEF